MKVLEEFFVNLLNNKLALSGWSFGAVCFLVLIYILIWPEKAKEIASWIYFGFSHVFRIFRKRYVASDIESRVNATVGPINDQIPGIIPYKVKIRWLNPGDVDRESFIQGDNAILVMDYYRNQNRNFVNTVALFVETALIPEARNYLEKDLSTSIDLTMSKKILQQGKRPALSHFVQNVLKPSLQANDNIAEYCDILAALDEAGFFTRILLHQLQEMGVKFYPRKIADPKLIEETREFTLFLEQIATKARGEDVELLFEKGKHIKVAIILVAKSATLWKYDIDAHVRRIGKDIRAGVDLIYLIAYGHNIKVIQRLAEKADETFESITIFDKAARPYKGAFIGERMKLACIPLLVSD